MVLLRYGLKALLTHPKLGTSWKGFAIEDLGLQRVIVLYPGVQRFPLADRVEAFPVQAVAEAASHLF